MTTSKSGAGYQPAAALLGGFASIDERACWKQAAG